MTHMFYKMVDDADHPTSWWLDEVRCKENDFDARALTRGHHCENPGTLTVAINRPGKAMALGFSLLFVPIVTTAVAELIDRMAPGAVERFPIEVGNVKGWYEALNVVKRVDAIDRKRSEYMLWNAEDDRPDKLGEFRQVTRLVIRDDIRQDAGIFRPTGWEVVLIVSAKLKKELEKVGNLAVCFRPLEGGFTAN